MMPIDEGQFLNVIESNKGNRVAVIDFYSPSCPHCRSLMGKMQRVENAYRDVADFYGVNIEESGFNHAWAQKMNVTGLPTLFIYRNGREVKRLQGDMPELELVNHIVSNASPVNLGGLGLDSL